MTTYKQSGVDIDKAEKAKEMLGKHVKATFTKDIITKFGLFSGAASVEMLKRYRHPALVFSIDGVGTKMIIAEMLQRYDTVGIDLVNHSINDVLTSGAKPLFFLDYIAAADIEPRIVEQLVKGISVACKAAGISILGGETAIMPDVYVKGRYDFAGAICGAVERDGIITGSGIKEGDCMIGLASSGLHTNGYSLARKVLLEKAKLKVSDYVPELKERLGDALLTPHKSYLKLVNALMKEVDVKGMAHITGGGFENIPRILRKGLAAEIRLGSWEIPPIFRLIQKKGNVGQKEMLRTFNMGIGYVAVVDKKDCSRAMAILGKYGKCWKIGGIRKGNGVTYR